MMMPMLIIRDPFYLKIVISMKVNGTETKEAEEECKCGRMVPFTKDTGKTTWRMGTADSSTPMGTSILGNGKATEPTERVPFLSFREIYFELWS
jgi:hypothetical protein